MGLTIHYALKSKPNDDIAQTVYKMRQLALDLPFEKVGEIIDLQGTECDFESRREELKGNSLGWLLIQASEHFTVPWNKHISCTIQPTRIIAFETWPGHGSESANFGLCLYPTEIELEYASDDDTRFFSKQAKGFDWGKYQRHCDRHQIPNSWNHNRSEPRKVPTKLNGWSWKSFCKTQYASEPECGGISNFLKCHVSVITLLDRMAKLPGLKVTVEDEGKYGPSTYSDDWEEATKNGCDPTYTRHPGTYSPFLLAKEVGEWNGMIAALTGAIQDALAINVESPIKNFSNFEQLEFKGRQNKHVGLFLNTLKSITTTMTDTTL